MKLSLITWGFFPHDGPHWAISLPSKLPSPVTSHKQNPFTSVHCCSVYTFSNMEIYNYMVG